MILKVGSEWPLKQKSTAYNFEVKRHCVSQKFTNNNVEIHGRVHTEADIWGEADWIHLCERSTLSQHHHV